jgi:hypothetical protein
MISDCSCNACGGVIGIYEPIVIVDGAAQRLTSRAAEPSLDPRQARYHEACRPPGGEVTGPD